MTVPSSVNFSSSLLDCFGADPRTVGRAITLDTTLGRALFNETLPADYPYVNYEVGKKALGAIVNDLATEELRGLKKLETYYAGKTRITDRSVEVLSGLEMFEELFELATRAALTLTISAVPTTGRMTMSRDVFIRPHPPRAWSSRPAQALLRARPTRPS